MINFSRMNVDIFEASPDIKYYFASAVPLMVLVLALWYFFKHSLASERQTPYQRGIYDAYFFKLATDHPQLWSRVGPRESIKPQTRLDRLRWRLILFWNDPEKTIRKTPGEDATYDDLDTWQRLKRFLTSRWTSQLRSFDDMSTASTLEGGPPATPADNSQEKIEFVVHEPDRHSTSSAPAVTQVDDRLGVPYSQPVAEFTSIENVGTKSSSPGKRPSSRDSSSARNSGIMIEEEPETWLQDYAPAIRRRTFN